MSAVRSAVDRVGGEITIASRRGGGTSFSIVIPKPKDAGVVEGSPASLS
jgi:sensor histidine kinase regulating citrate/malate metabolism